MKSSKANTGKFSPSALWDPGIEHGLTGLEANTFSHRAITRAPVCFVPLFTWNDWCLSRTTEEMGLPEEVSAQHWGHLRDKAMESAP